jgi:hypothetical protein
MSQPKSTLEKLDNAIQKWEALAPDKSFGGMTLAQFKTKVQPSFDTREALRALESQTQSKRIERENADAESLRLLNLVVNGVVGDPEEGPDGDLYEALGYTRTSQLKTGLTRKKKKNDSGGDSNK